MRFTLVLAFVVACGDNASPSDPFCDAWHQWGSDPGHHGVTCSAGQPLARVLADLIIDPFMAQEEADTDGDLVIHYQAPLLDQDALYTMTKRGTYTPCELVTTNGQTAPDCFLPDELYRLNTQIWTETRFTWQAGALAEAWSFESDWKPEPEIGFEPMFQPALVGSSIAIPGAAGSLWQLDAASGNVIRHITPFGSDQDTYVAGAIAVNGDAIYYNAIKLDHDQPFAMPSSSWLVAVAADGTVRMADYATLVTGAPAADALCFGRYDLMTDALPWPPASGALPMQHPCGAQRPGINSAPAFGPDGTMFVVTTAQHASAYSYIVAVTPDLSTKWATSLRNLLSDGCGVRVPYAASQPGNPFLCRDGAPMGIDPATGLQPAATVDNSSSSSPVALPDGGVIYGALTGYNGSRGHTIKLAADGSFAGSYDFGWDSTPAVIGSAEDYRIVIKDNHYGTDAMGVDLGPYFITQLDKALQPIWKFQSTETHSCERQPDGTLTCVEDHPHGFEWCINAPAIDRDGVTYVNGEDGNLYAINPDGTLRDKLFLEKSVGAAYTPLALDHLGRIYSLNNGHLMVLGAQ